ncbi:MAG: hypothetical protein OEN56_09900 [Gemmatimonadota bacterium]|nr:hypothetical protein [Gemmatimonadota bacterium]
MERIEQKRGQLEALRRQARRYRRWVLVILVVEVLALTGLLLSRTSADSPGAPPSLQF